MKHLQLEDFSPDNRRLVIEKPDKNFSVARNYSVIEAVIKENDIMQTKLHQKVQENAGNVADILSSFAKYKLDQDGGKQIEGYLGKHLMNEMYGEKLLEKIRMAEIIRADNVRKGNTKFQNFYLT